MVKQMSRSAAKNFGRYNEATQREPNAITSHGRTSGYFVPEFPQPEIGLLIPNSYCPQPIHAARNHRHR
jgi:hypothetical protein